MENEVNLSLLIENVSSSLFQILATLLTDRSPDQFSNFDSKTVSESLSIVRKALLKLLAITKFFIAKSVAVRRTGKNVAFNQRFDEMIQFERDRQSLVFHGATQLRWSSNFTSNIDSPRYIIDWSLSSLLTKSIPIFPTYVLGATHSKPHAFVNNMAPSALTADALTGITAKILPVTIKLQRSSSFFKILVQHTASFYIFPNKEKDCFIIKGLRLEGMELPLSQQHHLAYKLQEFSSKIPMQQFLPIVTEALIEIVRRLRIISFGKDAVLLSNAYFNHFLQTSIDIERNVSFALWKGQHEVITHKLESSFDSAVKSSMRSKVEANFKNILDNTGVGEHLTQEGSSRLVLLFPNEDNFSFSVDLLSGCLLVKHQYEGSESSFMLESRNERMLDLVASCVVLVTRSIMATITDFTLLPRESNLGQRLSVEFGGYRADYEFHTEGLQIIVQLQVISQYNVQIQDTYSHQINIVDIPGFLTKNSIEFLLKTFTDQISEHELQLCIRESKNDPSLLQIMDFQSIPGSIVISLYFNCSIRLKSSFDGLKVYLTLTGVDFSCWRNEGSQESTKVGFDEFGFYFQIKSRLLLKSSSTPTHLCSINYALKLPIHSLAEMIDYCFFCTMLTRSFAGYVKEKSLFIKISTKVQSEILEIALSPPKLELKSCLAFDQQCFTLINKSFDIFKRTCLYLYALFLQKRTKDFYSRFKELRTMFQSIVLVARHISDVIRAKKRKVIAEEEVPKASIATPSPQPVVQQRGKKSLKVLERKRSVIQTVELLGEKHFSHRDDIVVCTNKYVLGNFKVIVGSAKEYSIKVNITLRHDFVSFLGNGMRWGEKASLLNSFTRRGGKFSGKGSLLLDNKKALTVGVDTVVDHMLLRKLLI